MTGKVTREPKSKQLVLSRERNTWGEFGEDCFQINHLSRPIQMFEEKGNLFIVLLSRLVLLSYKPPAPIRPERGSCMVDTSVTDRLSLNSASFAAFTLVCGNNRLENERVHKELGDGSSRTC